MMMSTANVRRNTRLLLSVNVKIPCNDYFGNWHPVVFRQRLRGTHILSCPFQRACTSPFECAEINAATKYQPKPKLPKSLVVRVLVRRRQLPMASTSNGYINAGHCINSQLVIHMASNEPHTSNSGSSPPSSSAIEIIPLVWF